MLINSLRRFIAKGKNIDKYNDMEIKKIEKEDKQLSWEKYSVIDYRTANQMYNGVSLKWVFLGHVLQFTA